MGERERERERERETLKSYSFTMATIKGQPIVTGGHLADNGTLESGRNLTSL